MSLIFHGNVVVIEGIDGDSVFNVAANEVITNGAMQRDIDGLIAVQYSTLIPLDGATIARTSRFIRSDR